MLRGHVRRGTHLIRWAHAWRAHRDAALVFKAASEGRPLELEKRLRLGRLAGGLRIKGSITQADGISRMVRPLAAARLGGHDECVQILKIVREESDG